MYQIVTDAGIFYLKIARPPTTKARCEAEALLLVDLVAAKLPVVCPIPLRQGGYAQEISAGEGVRPTLLFPAAPLSPVQLSDPDQARQFGQLLANFHEITDRRAIDPDLPKADPRGAFQWIEQIVAGIDLSSELRDGLYRAADKIVQIYSTLPQSAPAYGIIHGDLARCNIRQDADGRLTLFDFGAAQYGWRANELLNVWSTMLSQPAPQRHEELWAAFICGYSSLGTLPKNTEALKPFYRLARKLATMAYICGTLTLRRGIEPISENNIAQQANEVIQMFGGLSSFQEH
ncbi:MAG TPA: phosphotransferase [Tepidisphaeraceae bacterium]